MDLPGIPEALARIQELVRLGLHAQAEAVCRQVTQFAPQNATGWTWLGLLLLAQRRYAEAEPALRRAVSLDHLSAQTWSHFSLALRCVGQTAEAERAIRQAIGLNPVSAEYWSALSGLLADQGRWADAAEALHQALSQQPNSPALWVELATAEQRGGRMNAAVEAAQRALALAPSDLAAQTKWADLLALRGQPQAALELAQSIVNQVPQAADAWVVLGDAAAVTDLPRAEAAFRRAVELAPDSPRARYGLALTLVKLSAMPQAESILVQFVADKPHLADAWALLGTVRQAAGRIDEALPALRQAVAVGNNPVHHSHLLHSLQCADGVGPEQLLAEHRQWDAAHAQPLLPATPILPARRDPATRLRIGFVSSDFGQNPSGFLALPCLEHLDKSRVEIVCYSDRLVEDEYTARFRAAAGLWRTVSGFSDEELARQIRADEIDILVDLLGHVGRRLLAFARRPAPLQMTWLGYVGTTGLSAMDCLIADRFHIREGEERWYVENVLRMPGDYACYGPPAIAPDAGPLPALTAGRVTFGCLNHPSKYTPRLLDAWAAILRRVAGSRLLLKNAGLDQPAIQDYLRGQFARRGIEGQRLLLEGGAAHAEFLAAYQRIDLALDTQPYSGGLTTCEALWMGVPVVTFPGRTFAGRHSVSHLSNAGLAQFIAADADSYVDLAAGWAQRLDELALLRSQMRQAVRPSPLCDAPRFARDFLSMLCAAWESRCAAG